MTRFRTLASLAATAAVALTAVAPAAHAKPIRRAGWLSSVTVTEYYPAPESWFVGKKVIAPGLTSAHRIDWLFSATGVSMEGDGVGLDGRPYYIDALGSGGWVDGRGKPSVAGRGGWRGGPPVWRAGAYWLSKARRLTFPLDGGGWSHGRGVRYVPLNGVTFAQGQSRPLRYYRSVAVDPKLIPLGSKVYIAAYRTSSGGGWFSADDTGGAIIGRHVDVYRTPPASSEIGGNYLEDQRIYVQPPGTHAARNAPGKPPKGSGGGDSGGGAANPPIPQPPAPPSGGASAP